MPTQLLNYKAVLVLTNTIMTREAAMYAEDKVQRLTKDNVLTIFLTIFLTNFLTNFLMISLTKLLMNFLTIFFNAYLTNYLMIFRQTFCIID